MVSNYWLWEHTISMYKFHEHGHIFRDCPLNTMGKVDNPEENKSRDDFTHVAWRQCQTSKKTMKNTNKEPPSNNSFDVLNKNSWRYGQDIDTSSRNCNSLQHKRNKNKHPSLGTTLSIFCPPCQGWRHIWSWIRRYWNIPRWTWPCGNRLGAFIIGLPQEGVVYYPSGPAVQSP
jgi:hypothetical protein